MTLTNTKWDLFSMVRIGKVQENNGRICPFLTQAIESLPSTTQEFMMVMRDFYESQEGILSETNQQYVDALKGSFDDGTLGKSLQDFYNKHTFPMIGKLGAFPAKYILIHDAHHILINVETDEQGEIDTIAFEGALINPLSSRGIVPLLSQIRAFENTNFDVIRVAKAWEVGCNVQGDLLETWDILADLNSSISSLQQKYNITPVL